MKNKLSKLFLITGVIFILYACFLFWKRINPYKLSFKNYTSTTQSKTKIVPVRLIIKSLNIDLPVVTQQIKNNTWETTDAGASYLINSHYIFYGHNWNNLLGNLVKAKPKMKIEIEFSDKTMRVFVIENTAEVFPNQSQVLTLSKKPKLIIYTCSGIFDEKRFVVTAL